MGLLVASWEEVCGSVDTSVEGEGYIDQVGWFLETGIDPALNALFFNFSFNWEKTGMILW